ncbi:uncharacterized protein VDAG_01370 [Verticillium dahliae VdLs.17]|uniref:CSI2 protein n=1 Tax=Verticillium dahliae (strain VdLs.17 / ATCC MYA-4575 / FGSC 10137) TaxID=498257 RepID=G2WU97_VERDV|nr:uncharacterized protein VDAG_01370 [Verticillium dahliae VdLs.17]EGY17688.1 hypothetical protein VDAG_01370 [Verticillium dahliae VdLs.17]
MVRLGFVARRRSPVLSSAVTAVALFTTTTFAQNGGNNNNNNANTNQPSSAGEQPETTAEAETTAAAASTAAESATPSPSADADVTISGGESATQPTATAATTSQTQGTATTTGGDVQITGGTDDGDAIMTFPTIETILEIPTYAPAAVPPTLHAPFMQHSTAPEGTVFIAVGAILGAFGLGILLWRGIVACLLHRSVRRAAMEQHSANDKAAFPAPPAHFYKYSDHNSSLSLSGAAAAARGVRRTNRGPAPPAAATPASSPLLLRCGSSSPGGNPHQHSISLTNLHPRPDSRGNGLGAPVGRAVPQHSPPESPQFTARREMSTSTLNLAAPAHGARAPSAYLEDLLDENPQAFPPSNMPPPNPQRQRSPGPRF